LDSILGDIDGISHLAAQTLVPRSIDEFYSCSSNNLLSTIKIFDLAQKKYNPNLKIIEKYIEKALLDHRIMLV